MGALQNLNEDLVREIGKIAAARGSLRQSFLVSIGALLCLGMRDQGIGMVLAKDSDLSELCGALITLAQVRQIPVEAVRTLSAIQLHYNADFEMAAAVANGMWTMLGGGQEPWYGLFEGEVAIRGCLEPRWKKIKVADLRKLFEQLNSASQELERVTWVIQGIRPGRRSTSRE
jgi:hypothetical protein